ncbi:MAG: alpha/beta hydrolase family protein [Woeseiaceae bacterium]
MHRFRYFFPLLAALVAVTACSSDQAPSATQNVLSIDTSYESRGVAVPATIVMPADSGDAPVPLVVMAHGHGGSRQEGGGFQMVAEAMAKRGIASIRMDFPGCGDSTESFAENNLTNMLLDLQAARIFAAEQIQVDADRVGLLGYSMGGRLVVLLSEIDATYQTMVTWAPAVSNGAEREIQITFGGPEAYEFNKRRALEEGSSVYTTQWGSQLEVGPGYFRDIEASEPLTALAKFSGPFLVIYGDKDDAVPPAVSVSAISAAINSREAVALEIPGAGHGFGFYTDNPEAAKLVVETSADFLSENL